VAVSLPQKESFVNALNIILLVLLFLSGALTVVLVLMHSGKGTGVSDMIASSLYNSAAGSGVWEKNLDRLTVITATVFIACIVVMAISFPTGTLG
jgi:preprotein translocase subunit SecG